MIKGKTILAIVPARGGSKGIPLKNLQKVKGKTLIEYVANVIKNIKEIDKSIVSTDNKKISQIAKLNGIEVPFLRPKNLSGDTISDLAVLKHALIKIEKIDKIKYDIILMLQPTSPLRTSNVVKECLYKLVEENLDSVWTISESDSKFHPKKQLKLDLNGSINFYNKDGHKIIARQQLDTLYHRNGVAYAVTRECLINQNSILGKKNGSIITKNKNVSIDTIWDLKLVEFILENKNHL